MESTLRPTETCERLFERYHTFTRRASISEPRTRVALFGTMQRTLGEWLPADRSAAILDVACGEGSLLCFLRERGYTNLSGCDVSPENVAICHSMGLTSVRQWNALELEAMPGFRSYDAIFAMDMIEHLPKEQTAQFLETLRRRLLPGGSVVVQTLNLGSLCGCFQRYSDLSHKFGLTERSGLHLMEVAGFDRARVELRPVWNATTPLGYLREIYARFIHEMVFLGEGPARPKVASKNLLIRGSVA